MQLSRQNAICIRNEISSITGRKINVMNAHGIIIASSDPMREGTLHAAAKKMIDEKLPEITVHFDNEYAGSLAGINNPLVCNGEIIGAIGITGAYQEVAKYGKLVCRMAEILIRHEIIKEQTDLKKQLCLQYMNEWLFGNTKSLTKDFVSRGIALGIDTTMHRRILIMFLSFYTDKTTHAEQQTVFDAVYREIKKSISQKSGGLTYISGNMIVCMVGNRTDSKILDYASHIKEKIESQYPVVLAIGIDSGTKDYRCIPQACIQAEKAAKAALRSSEKKICLYNNINIEIFSGEIPDSIKEEYICHIFRNVPEAQIRNWIMLLEVYYNFDASISKTAEKIGIHKNTLQYKLKKLKDSTGYDPRSRGATSLFCNAIYFYHDLYDKILQKQICIPKSDTEIQFP